MPPEGSSFLSYQAGFTMMLAVAVTGAADCRTARELIGLHPSHPSDLATFTSRLRSMARQPAPDKFGKRHLSLAVAGTYPGRRTCGQLSAKWPNRPDPYRRRGPSAPGKPLSFRPGRPGPTAVRSPGGAWRTRHSPAPPWLPARAREAPHGPAPGVPAGAPAIADSGCDRPL